MARGELAHDRLLVVVCHREDVVGQLDRRFVDRVNGVGDGIGEVAAHQRVDRAVERR